MPGAQRADLSHLHKRSRMESRCRPRCANETKKAAAMAGCNPARRSRNFAVFRRERERLFLQNQRTVLFSIRSLRFFSGVSSRARLVLAGAFTDVCIDALARTAFQKGFRVAVV